MRFWSRLMIPMKLIGVKMSEEEVGKEDQKIGETMTRKMKRDEKGKTTEGKEETMTQKTGEKVMTEERKEEKDLEMEKEEVPITGKEETLGLMEDPTADLDREVELNLEEESIEEGVEMNQERFTLVRSLRWKVRMKEEMKTLFLSQKLKILQS